MNKGGDLVVSLLAGISRLRFQALCSTLRLKIPDDEEQKQQALYVFFLFICFIELSDVKQNTNEISMIFVCVNPISLFDSVSLIRPVCRYNVCILVYDL